MRIGLTGFGTVEFSLHGLGSSSTEQPRRLVANNLSTVSVIGVLFIGIFTMFKLISKKLLKDNTKLFDKAKTLRVPFYIMFNIFLSFLSGQLTLYFNRPDEQFVPFRDFKTLLQLVVEREYTLIYYLESYKNMLDPQMYRDVKVNENLKIMFHEGLILQVESIPKAMEMVVNGTRNYAFLGDDLDVAVMQSKYCGFTLVRDQFLAHSEMGLYVRDGFDRLDITKINQGHAELTRIARSRLLKIYFPKKICPVSMEKIDTLSVRQMQSMFYTWFSMLALSLCTMCIELAVYHFKNRLVSSLDILFSWFDLFSSCCFHLFM